SCGDQDPRCTHAQRRALQASSCSASPLSSSSTTTSWMSRTLGGSRTALKRRLEYRLSALGAVVLVDGRELCEIALHARGEVVAVVPHHAPARLPPRALPLAAPGETEPANQPRPLGSDEDHHRAG